MGTGWSWEPMLPKSLWVFPCTDNRSLWTILMRMDSMLKLEDQERLANLLDKEDFWLTTRSASESMKVDGRWFRIPKRQWVLMPTKATSGLRSMTSVSSDAKPKWSIHEIGWSHGLGTRFGRFQKPVWMRTSSPSQNHQPCFFVNTPWLIPAATSPAFNMFTSLSKLESNIMFLR